MAYDKPDNSGALFVNDRKETDKHPDRTGTATINGVEYWVSGWIKKSQSSGDTFMSLAFKPKEQRRAPQPARNQTTRSNWNSQALDDEIPF